MGKDPNLPGAGDKQIDRSIGDFLDEETEVDVPDDWENIGHNAARVEEKTRPRREQMNLDIADDVKRRFKNRLRDSPLQMRFVVEDLVRLYLDRTEESS